MMFLNTCVYLYLCVCVCVCVCMCLVRGLTGLFFFAQSKRSLVDTDALPSMQATSLMLRLI